MQVQVPRESGAGHPSDVGAIVHAVRAILGRQRPFAQGHQVEHIHPFVGAQLAEPGDVPSDRDHDADSKDDIVTSTFAVPVNRPIQIMLRSKDVTHSFWVRELRLKQDLVPGMIIPMHFTANKTGRYEIACVELCGLGHYKMRAFFQVQSDEDFAKWMQSMAEAQ